MSELLPRERVARTLGQFAPHLLDASQRGSGWNSVWRLTIEGRPCVLKVYGRRRGPVKEWLVEATHALTGRSSYRPRGRQHTEALCLRLWHEAGLAVPVLREQSADPVDLPVPFLLMEYVDGRVMGDMLADGGVAMADKERVLCALARSCFRRHMLAIERNEPGLIQEHPDIMHVFVRGDELVTFDLEVVFLGRGRVRSLAAMEVVRTVRSLLRRLPGPDGFEYAAVFLRHYPGKELLEYAEGRLRGGRSPVLYLVQSWQRARAARRGQRDYKRLVAGLISAELANRQ